MSNDERNDRSAQNSEQPDEKPEDSERSSDESDTGEQATVQPAEQPMDQTQPEQESEVEPSEESDEQPAAVDQQSGQSNQVAEAEGQQTDKGDSDTTVATDDTPAADGDSSPDGDGGATAQPARGGSTRLAPRKRLFRFVVSADNSAVPDFIKNVFSPDPTDYFFGYAIAGAGDGNPLHMIEDSWERVPVDGIMDFPFSTVERKQFFIGVSVVPNSKVDPNAAAAQPLHRIGSMHTDDFAPIKATDAPTLVKKFPDGVFILEIKLIAFYIQIVDAGATTYEAELTKAKISPDDIIYNALSPFTDASGKVIGTKHDVVYWSTDLHLNGRKYVP